MRRKSVCETVYFKLQCAHISPKMLGCKLQLGRAGARDYAFQEGPQVEGYSWFMDHTLSRDCIPYPRLIPGSHDELAVVMDCS